MIRTPLSEKAYNLIREKVVNLNEGQYLSIRKLASEMEMSYTPVREAFQKLEKENLLERIPNVGYFVPQINIRQIEEIFQVRECIEAFVLAKVFDLITKQDLDRLAKLTDDQENFLRQKNIQQYIIWDQKFHMFPSEIYKNSYLIDSLKSVREKHLICSIKIARNESNVAINEHRELIDYMRRSDKEHALLTLNSHIENAKQRMRNGYISLSQWPTNMAISDR